jgi:hypothetical protein
VDIPLRVLSGLTDKPTISRFRLAPIKRPRVDSLLWQFPAKKNFINIILFTPYNTGYAF